MAQFLTYLDQSGIHCYVALDDISCVVAYEHNADGLHCTTAIYCKSDPDSHLSAQLSPYEVMNGEIVNRGKLL